MRKTCLECSEDFRGRADKKFCSAHCRSTYNNRLNSDSTNFIRNINNILRKNRRILAELNPTGKAHIHRDKLVEKGFKFRYFTNIYKTKGGRIYHFVYDYGYIEMENKYCTLVKRQEYVE